MVAKSGISGWGVGEIGEGGPDVPTSSYNTSHRDVIYSTVTIVNYSLLHV